MEGRKAGFWKGRLSDDGIVTEMYNYIWLLLDAQATGGAFDEDDKEPLIPISIPDTILYERGFPKAWYSWERTAGSGDAEKTLRKHLGKDIAVEAIVKKFCTGSKNDTVVAEYITLEHRGMPQGRERHGTGTHDAMNGGATRSKLQVQYLTPSSLAAFLGGRAPGSVGVLQRFTPTHTMHNASFEVVWSPCAATVSQARSSAPILDAMFPIRDRHATFDADPTQLRRVKIPMHSNLRGNLLQGVGRLMKTLSTTESIPMTGAVMYLKVDAKGVLTLQYCTSIRSKTLESMSGTRDPLDVGADFTDSPTSLGFAQHHRVRAPLPPPSPRRSTDNMRHLPPDSRVHLVAGGRGSPVILGTAYMPWTDAADAAVGDAAEQEDDQTLMRSITERILRLHSAGVVADVHNTRRTTALSIASVREVTHGAAWGMPSDHHRDERQTLLLFLEDMAYLTRRHRERRTVRGNRGSVANVSVDPPYFNEGTAFYFKIPPLLGRAIGSSGLSILCRELGWKHTATLADAHGHSCEYFSFPWTAPAPNNDHLVSVVMLVYPPVVLRKGRRSVSRRVVSSRRSVVSTDGAASPVDEDDDDEDEEDELNPLDPDASPTNMAVVGSIRLPSSTVPVIVKELEGSPPQDNSRASLSQSHLLTSLNPAPPAERLPTSVRMEGSACIEANRNTPPTTANSAKKDRHVLLALKPRRVDWRLASAFPPPPATCKVRQPMSAVQREVRCTLSASRKRMYYPEGQKTKPGPTVALAFGRKPDIPEEPAPLSEAAAQYMRKRSNVEEPNQSAWASQAPFAVEASAREKKPLDIMMEFWTQ